MRIKLDTIFTFIKQSKSVKTLKNPMSNSESHTTHFEAYKGLIWKQWYTGRTASNKKKNKTMSGIFGKPWKPLQYGSWWNAKTTP